MAPEDWFIFDSIPRNPEDGEAAWRFRGDRHGCLFSNRGSREEVSLGCLGELQAGRVEARLERLVESSGLNESSATVIRPPEGVIIKDGVVARWSVAAGGTTVELVLDRPPGDDPLDDELNASDWARTSRAWDGFLREVVWELSSGGEGAGAVEE